MNACYLACGGLTETVKRRDKPSIFFHHNAKKNRVLRQSRSSLLTVSETLFNNRCQLIEAEQGHHVGSTIPTRRSAWAGGAL